MRETTPASPIVAEQELAPTPLQPVPRGPVPHAPPERERRMIEITIDGQPVSVPEGSTILEAARKFGVETPTLCFLESLTPVNVCRVCVVEMEGARTLVPACSRKVEPKMSIKTDSERVRLSRRMVLEFLASSVDVSTAPQFAGYMERYGAQPQRFGRNAATVQQPIKIDNCVYCGNCIGVCPTGALMFKSEYDMRQAGTWDESRQQQTTTICPYCGVGCNLTVHEQDGEIVKVTSPLDHPVTHGNLCIKGRFGWQFVQIEPAEVKNKRD